MYDRSGLDKSEPSPLRRTSENIAKELQELLHTAKVEPPYVLVAHSYGGVMVREFLELVIQEVGEDGKKEGKGVVGAVFEECNTEFTYKERPENLQELFDVFTEGLDFNEIVGMETRHQMSKEEWEYATRDNTNLENETAKGESKWYIDSCDRLAQKKQFERVCLRIFPSCQELASVFEVLSRGWVLTHLQKVLEEWPVSIIKGDYEKEVQSLLDVAVEKGKGTTLQRNAMREFSDGAEKDFRLQEKQLELSRGIGRAVRAKNSGHLVHLTEPELITEEVRWIFEAWEEKIKEKNLYPIRGNS
jgi:hypothetical protein